MKKLFLSILCIVHCANFVAHAQTTLPRNVADEFGKLLVYHNDRICPMQTLARDYTIKLTGKPTYKDFSAEQVLLGWFFYYDEWSRIPMIKIKGKDAQTTLGIDSKYASANDFVSNKGYKLTGTRGKNYSAADEKYNLILMNATGSLMKIFPHNSDNKEQITDNSEHTSDKSDRPTSQTSQTGQTSPTLNSQLSTLNSQLNWFAINDQLPADLPQAEWLFIRKSMNLVAEYVALGHYDDAIDLLRKIRLYQERQLGSLTPSKFKLAAERIYNHFNYNRPFAIILMTLGIISYIYTIIKGNNCALYIVNCELVILTIVALYLAFSIVLRGIIAGHFPLANGFETMQFLALIAALLPIIIKITDYRTQSTYNRVQIIDYRVQNTEYSGLSSDKSDRPTSLTCPTSPTSPTNNCALCIENCALNNSSLLPPSSLLICGIALMVATMSELNPRITLLMPVLQSPLLSIHVMVIMISYALFALIALQSIANLIKVNNSSLLTPNSSLLKLALFLLTAGIFIGAIWANQSWGRYWGWDPKEVWALITMLIYSLPLHRASLPVFRNPRFLNWYLVLAFLSVIITYFGVNFILGGLHSYA